MYSPSESGRESLPEEGRLKFGRTGQYVRQQSLELAHCENCGDPDKNSRGGNGIYFEAENRYDVKEDVVPVFFYAHILLMNCLVFAHTERKSM